LIDINKTIQNGEYRMKTRDPQWLLDVLSSGGDRRSVSPDISRR